MADLEETVLTFKVVNPTGERYIDIAQCMSMVNQRAYPQQGMWTIGSVQLFADANDPAVVVGPNQRLGFPYTCSISGAPRTWQTKNALVKTQKAWKAQQRKALRAAGTTSIKPRWEDFKVHLNSNHFAAAGLNLTPQSGHMFGGSDAYATGEWIASRMVIEEVNAVGAVEEWQPQFHILGPNEVNDASLGLIHQYQTSRAFIQNPDPDTSTSLPWNLFTQAYGALSEQVEAITENMMVISDDPPYAANDYVGGWNNGYEPLLYGFTTNSNTARRKTTMNGFSAPNGLLEIQYSSEMPSNLNDEELWIQIVVLGRRDY